MRLIDDWRQCWRFWSLRLGMLGSAITSVLVAFPDAAIAAWALMPPAMQQAIPAQLMPLIGVAVFTTALVARLVRQDSLRVDARGPAVVPGNPNPPPPPPRDVKGKP